MKIHSKKIITNLILTSLVILLAIIPFFVTKDADFAGADEKAEAAIIDINPKYEPWFSSIWEPPSGEVESLIFSLQAAIGAGIIGYGLGYMKGKSKVKEG